MNIKNWVLKGMMLMLASGIALVSCLQVEDFEEALDKKYQEDWIKVLGDVDPNHDWSVAKQVTANFNLAGITNDEQTVRIYTSHPVSRNCYLLAETKINGSGSVSFDIEKSAKEVFIKMEDSRGVITMDGYFTIEGKELMADSRSLSGRSLSRSVPTYDTENYFSFGPQLLWNGFENNTIDYGDIYYINNNDEFAATSTYSYREVLSPIVRAENAVFLEGKNNRDLYQEELQTAKGVEYITKSRTGISLSYIFGATKFYNMFGYFYWDDNNPEGHKTAKRFFLIQDARPHSIITYSTKSDGSDPQSLTDGMQLSSINDSIYLTGKEIKLINYGSDYNGTPSYEFEEGTHIAFFLFSTKSTSTDPPTKLNKNQSPYGFYYSTPALNKEIERYYSKNDKFERRGEISAVTYQYGTYKFLGFEDGVDKDMNDILFIVDGDIKTNHGDLVDLDPNSTQAKPWVIACEDMGSIGDYDFNDAVFSVSHVGGSSEMTVTPLASGGTLPLQVFYDNNNIGDNKDFHQLINPQAAAPWSPINVGEKGTAGTPITIQVPENYSVESHGFKVVVEQNNGVSTTITQSMYEDKNQKAPQMLTLPSDWIWPKESHKIFDAYPYFVQWNSDANSYKDWYAIQQVNKHLVGYAGGSDDDSDEDNVTGGGTGGGTTSEWMSYCSEDKKTATIPKNVLPIGNNGINITINSSEGTNIIIGEGAGIWNNNNIAEWGTSITKTISPTNIENINGDSIVIWLQAENATITNIEISAAN